MENNEYEKYDVTSDPSELSDDSSENEQSSNQIDITKIAIFAGIVGFISSIGMGIKIWKTKRELKKANIALEKEREKNKLYQEAVKKHQAEINALKDDLEREEYKNRLWEELKSITEG